MHSLQRARVLKVRAQGELAKAFVATFGGFRVDPFETLQRDSTLVVVDHFVVQDVLDSVIHAIHND